MPKVTPTHAKPYTTMARTLVHLAQVNSTKCPSDDSAKSFSSNRAQSFSYQEANHEVDTGSNRRQVLLVVPVFLFFCTLWIYTLTIGGTDAFAHSATCQNGTVSVDCTYLPVISGIAGENAVTSTPTNTDFPTPTSTPAAGTPRPAAFTAIPVEGPPTDRIPAQHGDLNLSLRSYVETTAELTLVDNNGSADPNAPQIAGMFTEPRVPEFSRLFQVHEWDWSCEQNGCRAAPLASPPVTLLEMVVAEGEAIYIPPRAPQIFDGGYKALVLYAEAERITLTYLREDTVANGYAVHIENVQVDTGLLALYQTLHEAGRGDLPALKDGERLGNAIGETIKIAIRDRGTFMEPRSRKDWWQGY